MADRPSHRLFPIHERVLTVSELTGLIRSTIESEYGELWLEGEISNLRLPGSGHVYCTLKDESSQIRAVLFRTNALRVRFSLQEGMHVVVRGKLTVYERRGEYQIVLDTVEPKGIGALQLAFEQLRERLAAEGLFDERRKKPLPQFPRSVGIVTSLDGAALHDILTVLSRRWPLLHIVIVPVQVQGEGAAQQITDALAMLSDEARVDVVIVGRGGGSWEDLWSFNEEIVVRAIAESRIPVISAVGHEVDVTLADLVADHRAPTPSAAAERVVPVLQEVMERLHELRIRVEQAMARHCHIERRRFEGLARGMAHMRFRVQEESQRTDEATDRLIALQNLRLARSRQQVNEGQRELAKLNPVVAVKRALAVVPQFIKRLDRQIWVSLERRRSLIASVIDRLNALSPLAILGRGYSILSRAQDGAILRDAEKVEIGDEVMARLAKGRLRCTVNRISPDASV